MQQVEGGGGDVAQQGGGGASNEYGIEQSEIEQFARNQV